MSEVQEVDPGRIVEHAYWGVLRLQRVPKVEDPHRATAVMKDELELIKGDCCGRWPRVFWDGHTPLIDMELHLTPISYVAEMFGFKFEMDENGIVKGIPADV
jgi:hypothetical protein